jgi:hypothetical protein
MTALQRNGADWTEACVVVRASCFESVPKHDTRSTKHDVLFLRIQDLVDPIERGLQMQLGGAISGT